MIFDRVHKLVYACHSARTNEELLERFCRKAGYEKVVFSAVDADGQEIYHTNVLMALGENFVVICLESIRDVEEKRVLLEKFALTGKEVIEISYAQMLAFAGNMLQLKNDKGERVLVLSEKAFHSLSPTQFAQLSKCNRLLYSPIPTIEALGGGSVRCMMAEVFLPGK